MLALVIGLSYSFKPTKTCTVTQTTTVANPVPCNTCTGRITVLASGGSGFYSFSKDSGMTFQSSNAFLKLCAGDYYVQSQDNTGCLSAIKKVHVGCLQ